MGRQLTVGGGRPRRWWDGLGARTGLVVLLAVLPVVAVLVVSNLDSRREAREAAVADVERLRGLVVGQEERLLDGVRQVLVSLTLLPQVREGRCDGLGTVVDEHPHVTDLLVAAPDGAVLCSTSPLGPDASLGDRPFFQRVVSEREFSRGEYGRSPWSDEPVLRLAQPVLAQGPDGPLGAGGTSGEVVAVVVAAVDPEWVVDAARDAGMPRSGRVALVDETGTVLARYPDPDGLAGTDISGSPALAATLRLGRGTAQLGSADGVERIWAFDRVGDPRWPAYLQVGVDVEAVEAPAVERLRRDLAVTAAVLVLALLLGYVLSTALLRRPVDRLLTATRRVGSGDLGADPVWPQGRRPGGEIGELARAFDSMTGSLRDREATRRSAEARFRAAFDHSPTGMLLARAGEEGDGAVVLANRSARAVLGQDPAGTAVLDLFHPEDRAAVAVEHRSLLDGSPGAVDSERRLQRTRGGQPVWVRRVGSLVRGVDDGSGGGDRYLLVQLEDVSERRAALAELAHRATHDELTGLPNRALAFERISHAQARRRRTGSRFALVYCDLDRFKAVNDSLGHAAGDELLRVMAARLHDAVRDVDLPARLAGDEFLVVVDDLPADAATARVDATLLAERVLTRLMRPTTVEGHLLHPSVSIGVALPDSVEEDPSVLVGQADDAMYAAKRLGGHVEVGTGGPGRARDRLELEAELRTVLDGDPAGGRLVVHYQPVVDLRDGTTAAVEALVRWQHPRRGLVPPDEFLPVAEASGLVVRLGAHVLRTVAADQARWAEQGTPLRATVNVSPRQLEDPGLVPVVADVVARHPMGARGISLEVTETLLVHPNAATRDALEQVRELGVSLGMDDFGTGYASLSALRQLPVDFVKVDRSFVAGVVDSPDDAAVVRGVLAMAEGMDLSVIAEGVEDDGQRAVLAGMGCRLVQGYLTGRPVPSADVARRLAREQTVAGATRRDPGT